MHQCNNAYEGFTSYFSGYIEGDIDPETRKEIDTLIASCPECRDIIQRMNLVRDNFRSTPALATSPGFDQRLHQAIQNGHGTRSVLPDLPLPQLTNNWKFPAAIAAVFLAATAWFGTFQGNTSTGLPIDGQQTNQSSFAPTLSPPQQPASNTNIALPSSQLTESESDSVRDAQKKRIQGTQQLVNERK